MNQTRLAAFLLFVVCAVTASAQTIGTDTLLKRLSSFEWLPTMDGSYTTQFSSYDREGWNADAGNYLSENGDERVMVEAQGPGAVVRFWSANPSGRLRIYLDGAEQPAIDCAMEDVFNGKQPPFRAPLATTSSGGCISYFPIPFAKSVRITQTGGNRIYYHFNVIQFGPNTKVRTFNPTLSKADQTALTETERIWKSPADNLAKLNLNWQTVTIEPGKSVDLLNQTGPHVVRALLFETSGMPREALRKLALRAFWDGETNPSIAAPFSDFFGTAYGSISYQAAPMGIDGTAYYSLFPMPFARSGRITLENTYNRPVRMRVAVDVQPAQVNPDEKGYFHAVWSSAETVKDKPFRWFATNAGPGHFVGVSMTMQGSGRIGLWFLEGDEMISVDGKLTWHGTGTEDYFNSGWYFLQGPVKQPLHALLQKDDNNINVLRFHLNDRIPWYRSFTANLEHGGYLEAPGCKYQSVVYFYQKEPSEPFAELPMDQITLMRRVVGYPVGWTTFAATASEKPEFARLTTPAPEYRLASLDELTSDLRADFKPMVADRGHLSFEVLPYAADEGDLSLLMLRGRQQGTVQTYLNGSPLGGPITLASDQPDTEVITHHLGRVTLKPGDKIELKTPDTRSFTAIAITLRSAAPFIREWMISNSFPSPGGANFEKPLGPEIELGNPAVTWKKGEVQETGFLNLRNQLTPIENSIAYAVTQVESPDDRETELVMGSDDSVRVWLNGQLIHSNKTNRHALPEQDFVRVNLRKGTNLLMFKVENGLGGWGLFARLRDPSKTLTYSAPDPKSWTKQP